MSIFFISDLHLGHRTIVEKSAGMRGGTTTDEHDNWVIQQILKAPLSKRTILYVLGDICFDEPKLELLNQIPGRKICILGNHCQFHASIYLKYFENIRGAFKKYGMWITHIPIHPGELRNKPCIHGHCHTPESQLNDPRYLNCAIEWVENKQPISLDRVREIFKERGCFH